MSRNWDEFKDAAEALPAEYLGSAFSSKGGNDLSVKAVQIKALFDDNKIMLGQAGGSVDGMQLRSGQALAKHFQDVVKRDAARQRSTSDTITWLTMLDDHIDWLDKQIADKEKGFAKTDGEEWREKLALKVLDKDDIPEREDGETMEAYRERLERVLIDEMLDDEGNINPEYKDHPELGKYAEWAEQQFDRREAIALNADISQPGVSAEETTAKIDKFSKTASFERLNEARLELKDNAVAEKQISAARDQSIDDVTDVTPNTSENGFI